MFRKYFAEYKNLILIGIILIISALVYINCLGNDFIWDDQHLIVKNAFIKNWKYLPEIFGSDLFYFSSRRSNFYRPLQTLSYMVDYSCWHLNPFGYHLTNLFFHFFNAFLVFRLASLLAQHKLFPFFAALLFGIHPVHTEAVTYISGRADLISFFFLLLSLIAYIAYANKKGVIKKYYILSLLFFVLAVLSKETALILPFLLILFDCSFKSGEDNLCFKDKIIKRYLLFFAVFFIYIFLRSRAGSLPDFTVLNEPGFYARFITMLKIVTDYILLIIFPLNLHMERFAAPVLSIRQTLISAAIWVSAILFMMWQSLKLSQPLKLHKEALNSAFGGKKFLVVKSYKYSRIMFFASAWFFVTLVPVLNIFFILNAEMAEHWLYLPSAGFFMVISCMMINALNSKSMAWLKILSALIFIIAVICYSLATIKRNSEWGDEVLFFKNIIKNNPGLDIDRAHDNLARAYYRKGAYYEAEVETKKALAVNPDYPEGICMLGVLYGNKGNYNEAIKQFKNAIMINPYSVEAYDNLAITYAKLGDYKKAIELWNKILEINPYNEAAKLNIKKAKSLF